MQGSWCPDVADLCSPHLALSAWPLQVLCYFQPPVRTTLPLFSLGVFLFIFNPQLRPVLPTLLLITSRKPSQILLYLFRLQLMPLSAAFITCGACIHSLLLAQLFNLYVCLFC